MTVKKRAPRRRRKATTAVAHRAPVKHRTTATRRRRRTYSRKGKTLLSEAFNPAAMKSTGSALISGGLGFFAMYQLLKTMQGAPAIQRTLLGGAVAFISGAWLGMPNLAAGMGGGVVLDLINTQSNKMSENNYLSPGQVAQLPEMLSEDYLAAAYMNQDYLAAPYMSSDDSEYTDYIEMD